MEKDKSNIYVTIPLSRYELLGALENDYQKELDKLSEKYHQVVEKKIKELEEQYKPKKKWWQ